MEKLKAQAASTENVFLFVPNIIGYVRVALALAAFAAMQWSPVAATGLYLSSALLDAVDGHAARTLNQMLGVGAVPLLLLLTAPVCLLKTLISCVHLVSASSHIAALDAQERKRRS